MSKSEKIQDENFHFKINKEILEKIKEEAKIEKMTTSEFVRSLLKTYLIKKGKFY